jgi:HK97 family phage portal protein
LGLWQRLEKRFAGWLGAMSTQWYSFGPPAAGVNVTEFTALQLTTVYACVRIIAETIASLPLNVYKHLDTGGKTKAPNHPLHRVLHDEANPDMSAFVFWETMVGHLLLWGNAYAEIERDGMNRVIGLYPLNPAGTFPYRQEDGSIVYKSTLFYSGTQVTLPAWKVLHLHGLGFDGRQGYSPIHMAKETLSGAKATEEYGARFFSNGGKPSGVLEMDGVLKDNDAVERLRNQWQEIHGGAANAHKVAILENGLKYKPISLPPEDAQFLETRKWQKAEIAQLYRVPLHMLADLERATFSNIEHQSIEFVVHTIRPWLVRIEQEIRRKCFSDREKSVYFAEFLVDGLLRGDVKSRSEALQIQRQNGIINADEWREIENMNPQEGDQGKKYLVNSAMIAVDQIGMEQKGGDGNGQGTQGSAGSSTTDPKAGGGDG